MSEHKNLAEALCAFQAEAPTLPKDKTAEVPTKSGGKYSYKYTDLGTIVEKVMPLLTEHGLTWSCFPTVTTTGQPGLRFKLAHVSGDVDSDVMPLLLAKQDSQGLGSALTYARRYAMCAVLNLVADEDDDGKGNQQAEQASGKRGESASPSAHPSPAPAELASSSDVVELKAAALSLSKDDIKLALGSCGLSGVTAYNKVPKDKVLELMRAFLLAGEEAA